MTRSLARLQCFRFGSHLLPLTLKQYLGLLPNFEQPDTMAVYDQKRVLREAAAARSARTRTRGREEAKALKCSLPPPPPFCPRHQNKRADTRVPMTLVYYQVFAVPAPLGYVVQPVSLACGFQEVEARLRLRTHNPFRGQSLA